MKPTLRTQSVTLYSAVLFSSFLLIASCRTLPLESRRAPDAGANGKPPVPVYIMGAGSIPASRYLSFFMENSAQADRRKVERMASYYIEEGKKEGVNSDVAFVQMCLETGFLSFRGLVTEDMHNFCGLGTVGAGQPGNRFPDERTGVRAHIQHLKAYGSTEPPSQTLVDPRYKYVNPKGKAPTIYGLSGTWASDPAYGAKLEGLLARLYG